jgi:hypothetical protein
VVDARTQCARLVEEMRGGEVELRCKEMKTTYRSHDTVFRSGRRMCLISSLPKCREGGIVKESLWVLEEGGKLAIM